MMSVTLQLDCNEYIHAQLQRFCLNVLVIRSVLASFLGKKIYLHFQVYMSMWSATSLNILFYGQFAE